MKDNNVKVIFSVKNGKYYNKENQEFDILNCELKVLCFGDAGEEAKPFVAGWKDFKQKAFDFEREISKNDIIHEEKGIKILGFSIPWTNQFFINQLIELGFLK